jgi:fumarate reductase subunit D
MSALIATAVTVAGALLLTGMLVLIGTIVPLGIHAAQSVDVSLLAKHISWAGGRTVAAVAVAVAVSRHSWRAREKDIGG